MINFKQCANYLIEKEGVWHEYDDERSHYKNNEIEMSTTIGDKDYSSVVISFLDEKVCDRKNEVRIIMDRNPKEVRVVFRLENDDDIRIIIDHDRRITYFGLDGNYVNIERINNREFEWFEPNPSHRATINLIDYDAKDVVENIRRSIVGNVLNPRFDRLFEIIRPILVLNVLEINISTVIKGLYGDIEAAKDAIQAIDKALSKDDIGEKTRAITLEYKKYYERRIEETKDIIDIDQCSIYDEYEPFIQKEKVR